MPTYQVTYFKRAVRAADPFASESRTEFVRAKRIVNERPLANFYADGLVLSERDKDLKAVKEPGVDQAPMWPPLSARLERGPGAGGPEVG
jgi:hypothetical protein